MEAGVARYYDPTTAQFLTRDPAERQTGQAYTYAAADPLDLGDPTGLFCWSAHCLIHDAADAAGGVSLVAGVAGNLAGPTPLGAALDLVAGTTGAAAAGLDYASGDDLGAAENATSAVFGLLGAGATYRASQLLRAGVTADRWIALGNGLGIASSLLSLGANSTFANPQPASAATYAEWECAT